MVHQPDTKIKLNIQTFKKGRIAVELNDSDTLIDLVEALSASTSKTPAQVSDFYCHKTQLSDGNMPFHVYGITDGSVLVQYYQEPFHIQLEDAR